MTSSSNFSPLIMNLQPRSGLMFNFLLHYKSLSHSDYQKFCSWSSLFLISLRTLIRNAVNKESRKSNGSIMKGVTFLALSSTTQENCCDNCSLKGQNSLAYIKIMDLRWMYLGDRSISFVRDAVCNKLDIKLGCLVSLLWY
jgi:hypothetical protein